MKGETMAKDKGTLKLVEGNVDAGRHGVAARHRLHRPVADVRRVAVQADELDGVEVGAGDLERML